MGQTGTTAKLYDRLAVASFPYDNLPGFLQRLKVYRQPLYVLYAPQQVFVNITPPATKDAILARLFGAVPFRTLCDRNGVYLWCSTVPAGQIWPRYRASQALFFPGALAFTPSASGVWLSEPISLKPGLYQVSLAGPRSARLSLELRPQPLGRPLAGWGLGSGLLTVSGPGPERSYRFVARGRSAPAGLSLRPLPKAPGPIRPRASLGPG